MYTNLIASHLPGYAERNYRQDAREAVQCFAPSVYRFIVWRNTGSLETYRKILSEAAQLWPSMRPELRLMPGIDRAIRALSATRKLGILGQYGEELRHLLDGENLLGCFYRADTQERFNRTKPDPRYFADVVSSAGAAPGQSVMVGDRIDKDVIPAKMIGMRTIRIRVGLHKDQQPRTPEEEPDITLEGVADLPDAVNDL